MTFLLCFLFVQEILGTFLLCFLFVQEIFFLLRRL